MDDSQPATAADLPDGDYAIIGLFGKQRLVGRIEQVERFGSTMCQIEVIWKGRLLPPVYRAGGALFEVNPCSKELAFKNQATGIWDLPETLACAAALVKATISQIEDARDIIDAEDTPDDDEPVY